MPQRRGSGVPLKNCTLYFAFGEETPSDFRKALELVARDTGARVAASSRTRGVSHVIVPTGGIEPKDDVLSDAFRVRTTWLIDAAERGKRPDERDYSCGPSSSKPATTADESGPPAPRKVTPRSRRQARSMSVASMSSLSSSSSPSKPPSKRTSSSKGKARDTTSSPANRRSRRGSTAQKRSSSAGDHTRIVLAVSAVDDATRTRAEELQNRVSASNRSGRRGGTTPKRRPIEVLDEGERGITHIVVGTARRTQKLLLAVAGGAWVLTPEWLRRCSHEAKLLPEEEFEVDPNKSPLFAGAVASRQAGGGLLRDVSVCIGRLGSQDPLSRDELVALVETAGGSVATEPGGADAYVLGRAGQRNRGFMPDPRDSDAECPDPVKLEWLLDSISSFERLPQASYRVDVTAEKKKLVRATPPPTRSRRRSRSSRTASPQTFQRASQDSDASDESDAQMKSAKSSPAQGQTPPSTRKRTQAGTKSSPESDVHMEGTSRPVSPQWEEAESVGEEENESESENDGNASDTSHESSGFPTAGTLDQQETSWEEHESDDHEKPRSRSSSVAQPSSPSHDELGIVSISHEPSHDELAIVSVDSSLPVRQPANQPSSTAVSKRTEEATTDKEGTSSRRHPTATPVSPEPPLFRRRRTFLRTPPSAESKRSSPMKHRDTPTFHAPTPPHQDTADVDAESIELGRTPSKNVHSHRRKRQRQQTAGHTSDDPISDDDDDDDDGSHGGEDSEARGGAGGAARVRRLRMPLQRPAKKPFVRPRSAQPQQSRRNDSSPIAASGEDVSLGDASQRPDGYTDVPTLDRNAASQVSLDDPDGYSSESQTF